MLESKPELPITRIRILLIFVILIEKDHLFSEGRVENKFLFVERVCDLMTSRSWREEFRLDEERSIVRAIGCERYGEGVGGV